MSRISRTNTRLTECWNPVRTVKNCEFSEGSKLVKLCSPPPVANASPGLPEYLRSIAASSIAENDRKRLTTLGAYVILPAGQLLRQCAENLSWSRECRTRWRPSDAQLSSKFKPWDVWPSSWVPLVSGRSGHR